MNTQTIRHIPAGRPVRQDFATRRVPELDNGQWNILNLTDRIALLTEAHRASKCPNERREIVACRFQLQVELRAARAALHPTPLRVSTFRRFVAWLLT